MIGRQTYFFALKKAFPRSFGNSGITRSSAKNKPFSFKSILRASNGLNFPLSFSTPTVLEINLMLCDSNRSLYSRCGSFVIKHIGVVRGSISGWDNGLLEARSSGLRKGRRRNGRTS